MSSISNAKSNVKAKIIEKRIPKDIKQLLESKDFTAVTAIPDNMTCLWVKFKNVDGYYRNQTHVLEIKLDTAAHEYPFTAPNVKFLTPIFHTNVSEHGTICLSILKEKNVNNPEGWTEAYNFCSIIQAIFLLLECPNTASPFNSEASRAWTDSKQGKLEEQYIDVIDKYYMSHNYKNAINEFDRRYDEDYGSGSSVEKLLKSMKMV